MTKKLLLILGMHRSGTSALSGLIESSGVYFGDNLLASDEHNPKGYYENRKIFTVHEKMLYRSRYRWDSQEKYDYKKFRGLKQFIYKNKIRNEIKRLLKNNDVAGIKDPRTCMLLPIWNKITETSEYKTYNIITVRHPAEVALSHKKRDGFTLDKALNLWLNYNQSIIENTRNGNNFYTSFAEVISQPEIIIEDLSKLIKQELDSSKANTFIDEKLKNNKVSEFENHDYNSELYNHCLACYEDLISKNRL